MPPKAAGKTAPAASTAAKPTAKAPPAKTNGTTDGKAKREVKEDRPERPDRAERDDFIKISGKPDKDAHEAELNALTGQIEKLQKQSDDLRNKISNKASSDPNQERKKAIRAELETLRGDQAGHKAHRDKVLGQIKSLQDKISSKGKELQASKGKSSFKSVAEVDAQIKSLEKSVETGSLKVVDEKKALQEISTLKKQRKTIESFGSQQEDIDGQKKQIDELRATLDNTESKAVSDKYSTLRTELDSLSKQSDDAFSARGKLMEERDKLKASLDELHQKRKDLRTAFREANDKYYQKVQDARAAQAEKRRAERQAYEDEKRTRINSRILEDASEPAYEREIEDTKNLINYFRSNSKGAAPALSSSVGVDAKTAEGLAALPQLNVRTVESELPKGAVAFKKQDEDLYAGKSKAKGRKPAAERPAASQSLNLPMSTLSALLQFGISAPLSQSDLPKTIEALEEKHKFFKDNQEAETQKRIASAHAKIAAAEKNAKGEKKEKPAPAKRASEEAVIPAQTAEAPKTTVGETEPTTNGEVTATTAETA